VRLQEITKTFPGVKALDKVSLTINSGEVLALVGENGAGKSTLMKILSGVYDSYQGKILVNGAEKKFFSPLDAEAAGISIIHQELSTFLHLTVAENMYVGHWPKKLGLVDWKKFEEQAKYWLDQIGATCDPQDKMSELSVGNQQMVEIAKALSKNSDVLILDEPTSALTPKEVKKLFDLLLKLKAQGKGLVYISHKMEEIYKICDRISVLRDGQVVGSAMTTDFPEEKLISQMVGRPLNRMFPKFPDKKLGENILSLKNYSGKNSKGRKVFDSISFELKKGEILGFAGLLGAGRSELLKSVFGDHETTETGAVSLRRVITKFKGPRDALRNGVAYVSEDRKRESIFSNRSINENVSMARLSTRSLFRLLNNKKELALSEKSVKQLGTRCTSSEQHIQSLSGGNQQKVIIARALQIQPDIVILDEPTRGIDVGAKYEIYEILFKLASEGKALLVISSDLPELMGLCDRVLVLSEGKQMAILDRSEFSQETIMTHSVGHSPVLAQAGL